MNNLIYRGITRDAYECYPPYNYLYFGKIDESVKLTSGMTLHLDEGVKNPRLLVKVVIGEGEANRQRAGQVFTTEYTTVEKQGALWTMSGWRNDVAVLKENYSIVESPEE